jgi:hypothetical protein
MKWQDGKPLPENDEEQGALRQFLTEGPFRVPTTDEVKALEGLIPSLDIFDAWVNGNDPLINRLFACIFFRRPIPDKLRTDYLFAINDVHSGKTWDDVFGDSQQKGKHREKARQKDKVAVGICFRVEQRHKSGETKDKALFESVGREFGVNGTDASHIYYKQRAVLTLFTDDGGPTRERVAAVAERIRKKPKRIRKK